MLHNFGVSCAACLRAAVTAMDGGLATRAAHLWCGRGGRHGRGLAAFLELLVLHIAVAAMAAMGEGLAASLEFLVLRVDPTCLVQAKHLEDSVDRQAHLGSRRQNCADEPVGSSNTASACCD